MSESDDEYLREGIENYIRDLYPEEKPEIVKKMVEAAVSVAKIYNERIIPMKQEETYRETVAINLN